MSGNAQPCDGDTYHVAAEITLKACGCRTVQGFPETRQQFNNVPSILIGIFIKGPQLCGFVVSRNPTAHAPKRVDESRGCLFFGVPPLAA